MITVVNVESNIAIIIGGSMVKVIVSAGLSTPSDAQIIDAISGLPEYLNDDDAISNGSQIGDLYFFAEGTDVGIVGTLKKILPI